MAYLLGKYLHKVRRDKGYSIREVCRKVEDSKLAGGITVSPSYYSQVENGAGINPEKVSMDFFWAVSCVLETDPMDLFVLSRPQIPRRMLDRRHRNRAFDLDVSSFVKVDEEIEQVFD